MLPAARQEPDGDVDWLPLALLRTSPRCRARRSTSSSAVPPKSGR